ncbi:hypothetical protein SDRG_00199 [Saprolegnia diclina VS20]|uniref:N-acetyltransferase domain-containing protein n=1 Tax=Saprolegnia diclina (strain VS20) TaxID=1156394 RepID=T0R7P9_SAPDV|nr:hypothetical protein SDRG_00199 [Saprolegnia diclina VS20]EQC42465.1 hypothetical protein SDRG_00199 [Saprolegnia diclina VS20]|eukprot:XP_008603888.1 hypothetical protein SDRG_00199 [Saprolegnia diclina VS20]
MRTEVVPTFCALASEPLPPEFIGPLGAILGADDADLHLFALDGDYVVGVASTADTAHLRSVAGLAYVIHYTVRDTLLARFWLPRAESRSGYDHAAALQRLLGAVAATASAVHPYFTLSAFPERLVPATSAIAHDVAWVGDTYEVHDQLSMAGMPTTPSHALGQAWADGDDVFVMDTLKASDAARVIALATVEYDAAYIEFLASHPFYSKFARVVRLQATGDVVSSCVIHGDFSLGLVSTDPTFLRRGLAHEAVHATLSAVRTFLKESPMHAALQLRPFSAIKVGNTPSAKMMAKFGFAPRPNANVVWMGVHL